jgi:hypothetical protein
MCCSYRLAFALVICAACGSVKDVGHLPDAPPAPDAGIDAATHGTVHVTVLDPSGSGVPAAGMRVVFLDPDGSLVKTATTDASGKAEADVRAGASVTSVAFAPQTTAYQIETVFAVQPGDDLILGSKDTVTTTIGTFTVTYPAYTVATPASYTVGGPCGFVTVPAPAGAPPPTTATLSFTSDCKLDTMELVVIANDATKALGFLTKTGVPFAANGSANLSGAYQPALGFTGTYTNVNANVANLNMRRKVPDGLAPAASATATPPTASQVLNITGAIGTAAQVETQVQNTSRAQQLVRKVLAGAKPFDDMDLGATLLPWLGIPTLDAATGKITLPVDTTGTGTATPDIVEVIATYRRTDPVTGATTGFTWALFSPVLGDITLPKLPPDAGNVMPAPSDTILRVLAAAFESDAVASYDAVHSDPFGSLPRYTGNRPLGTMLRTSISPLVLR